jgi:flagellar protein FlaG
MGIEIHSIQNRPAAEQYTPPDLPHQQAAKAEEIRKSSEKPVDLHETIASLNRISTIFNKHLKYSINEELNQVVVKVIDKDTDKVIKEIPPEEIQRLSIRIREAIGILFDETI